MYGIINRALKDMIVERFGDETWRVIALESGVSEESFLSMRSYDDETTYALVGAASKVLEAPAEDCLHMFGVYWINTTATEHYATLMDAAGDNLVAFLKNLNLMHDRISTTFLNYVPPYFQVNDGPEDTYHLHYISTREGLMAFVRGLLEGLSQRFGQTVTVLAEEERQVSEGSHIVFHIRIS